MGEREKKKQQANETNFKGCAFNFEGLREHSGAFQIKLPTPPPFQNVAAIKSL